MAGQKDLKKEFTGMSITTLEPSRSPSAAYGALQGSPIPSVRKLVLHETDHSVVILGQVTSYYQKQMAQEAVKPVLGQRTLLNRVQVVPDQQAVDRH
jgi:hypothetical protein